jgi:putative addiction module component (TIGR02574 family)
MTSSAPKPIEEQLLEQALRLPKAQRLRLVDQIWESLDQEDSHEPIELDPQMQAELTRRLKSIEDGTAVLLDGDEVMRELRAKFSAR